MLTENTEELTIEECCTVLREIEGIIISCPLTYRNEELEKSLTSSHLIIDRRILDRSSPIHDIKRNSNRDTEATEFRKRANHLRNEFDLCRNRLRRAYFTELRKHQKFKKPRNGRSVSIGDVEKCFEDRLP